MCLGAMVCRFSEPTLAPDILWENKPYPVVVVVQGRPPKPALSESTKKGSSGDSSAASIQAGYGYGFSRVLAGAAETLPKRAKLSQTRQIAPSRANSRALLLMASDGHVDVSHLQLSPKEMILILFVFIARFLV